MNFLFLFLDGVGLGRDDQQINPLSRAHMPFLRSLLDGQLLLDKILNTTQDGERRILENERLSLIPLDARLGVAGLPQSATGQATLLTGTNIPGRLGYHYGPKPNRAVADYLCNGNLFHRLKSLGMRCSLLNAYPESYFKAIESGRRLLSAIPLAVTKAGIPLKTSADLFSGQALSADFTGQGWIERLGFPQTPLLEPYQAGERLAYLARDYDFAFFEYWLSDYAGHKQDMPVALSLLETLDQVLAGLVAGWDGRKGLILITSDHGNLEDLSTRRHTLNPVPALVIGEPGLRRSFAQDLQDLTGVANAILKIFQ
jgi:2,3-bisphosphoglycerate-independent phosphoglycerate mutase